VTRAASFLLVSCLWASAAAEEGPVRVIKGVAIANGRAMQQFGGSPSVGERFSEMANAYAAHLGPQVKVYSIVVPTAISFYLPGGPKPTPEGAAILAGKAKLGPGVTFVDAYAEIERHTAENLYFRSDTHWTVRAAYYTYVAFCAAAGFRAVPLSAMERGVHPNFKGYLYGYTKDPSLLTIPDEVEYFMPTVPYEASLMSGPPEYATARPGTFVEPKAGNYVTFLGGDHALLVGRTRVDTRRRALVIKNSYGNPFAPFLLPHFEQVLVVDYRYFEGRIDELVRKYQVTDVLLINPTLTAYAKWHLDRTWRILDHAVPRSAPATAAPAPKKRRHRRR